LEEKKRNKNYSQIYSVKEIFSSEMFLRNWSIQFRFPEDIEYDL